MTAIYLKQGDDLIPMDAQPYDAEAVLQGLLEDHPALLAGGDGEGEANWLLIQREASVPDSEDGAGRWSLDHLFVDRDAVPTLVEVKRSSDTRIRWEVVAQMLDYAANAPAHWPADHLRTTFEARVGDPDAAAEQVAALLDDSETEPGETGVEDSWSRVSTNLSARRLRLVFVADVIPPELRAIVEFLNDQMTQTDVLALEVKQYVERGGDRTTLVPRLIGDTARATATKGRASTPRKTPGKVTTQQLLQGFRALLSPEKGARAIRLRDWLLTMGASERLGTAGSTLFFDRGDSGRSIRVAFWINGHWDEAGGVSINFVHFSRDWTAADLDALAGELVKVPGLEPEVAVAHEKDYKTWMACGPALDSDENLAAFQRAIQSTLAID